MNSRCGGDGELDCLAFRAFLVLNRDVKRAILRLCDLVCRLERLLGFGVSRMREWPEAQSFTGGEAQRTDHGQQDRGYEPEFHCARECFHLNRGI